MLIGDVIFYANLGGKGRWEVCEGRVVSFDAVTVVVYRPVGHPHDPMDFAARNRVFDNYTAARKWIEQEVANR